MIYQSTNIFSFHFSLLTVSDERMYIHTRHDYKVATPLFIYEYVPWSTLSTHSN